MPSPLRWRISGMFTEACSCAPPCGCNFGLASSPHDFCYTLFAYAIKTGTYRTVKLDGLILAHAKAQGGSIWYIDRRATPPQAAALRAIATRIAPSTSTVIPAVITQEVTERGSRLQIEGVGGFDNTFLVGLDGKTPIVVLNNATFNLKRSIKGQTDKFRYKDQLGSRIDYTGTNTNTGEFEYDQSTRRFFGGMSPRR
jgi:hypothetical protein